MRGVITGTIIYWVIAVCWAFACVQMFTFYHNPAKWVLWISFADEELVAQRSDVICPR